MWDAGATGRGFNLLPHSASPMPGIFNSCLCPFVGQGVGSVTVALVSQWLSQKLCRGALFSLLQAVSLASHLTSVCLVSGHLGADGETFACEDKCVTPWLP